MATGVSYSSPVSLVIAHSRRNHGFVPVSPPSMFLYQSLKFHTSDVNCMDFNGRILATGSSDKLVRLFYLEQKLNEFYFVHHHMLKAHDYSVTCISFNVFGTLLGSGSHEGKIIIWKLMGIDEPIVLHTLIGPSNLKAFVFGPLNNQSCATGDGNDIILWNGIGSDQMISQRNLLVKGLVTITTAVFSPKGTFLICGSSDGKLSAWNCMDTETSLLHEVHDAHDLGVTACDIKCSTKHGSNFLLATAGHDDLVKIWNVSYDKDFCLNYLRTCKGHRNSVYSVKFRTDAKVLVSTGNDHKIMLWDPARGTTLFTFEAHDRAAITCCYVDDTFLATGSIDKTVCIWKLDLPGFCFGTRIKPTLRPKNLLEWNVSEVVGWIRELGYPQYADSFRNHDISGVELLHMTLDGLNHGLGISIYGHCMRILKEVYHLKNPLVDRYSEGFASDDSWPQEFLCPITRELMRDPVVLEDGTSYERCAIDDWFARGHDTSPSTNQVLTCHNYFPNLNLISLMRRFQE